MNKIQSLEAGVGFATKIHVMGWFRRFNIFSVILLTTSFLASKALFAKPSPNSVPCSEDAAKGVQLIDQVFTSAEELAFKPESLDDFKARVKDFELRMDTHLTELEEKNPDWSLHEPEWIDGVAEGVSKALGNEAPLSSRIALASAFIWHREQHDNEAYRSSVLSAAVGADEALSKQEEAALLLSAYSAYGDYTEVASTQMRAVEQEIIEIANGLPYADFHGKSYYKLHSEKWDLERIVDGKYTRPAAKQEAQEKLDALKKVWGDIKEKHLEFGRYMEARETIDATKDVLSLGYGIEVR